MSLKYATRNLFDTGSDLGLVPKGRHAITWTKDGLVHQRIYAALGGDELKWHLGDNDRAARVLFVQHPREQGEWCSQNPSVARVLT